MDIVFFFLMRRVRKQFNLHFFFFFIAIVKTVRAIVCDLCLPTRTAHFRWRSAIKSVKNVFQILLCVCHFNSSKSLLRFHQTQKKIKWRWWSSIQFSSRVFCDFFFFHSLSGMMKSSATKFSTSIWILLSPRKMLNNEAYTWKTRAMRSQYVVQ